MARVALTPQTVVRAGVQPTQVALIADGHSFLNEGKLTFIEITNGITAFTLTIQTPQTIDGLAVAERTISIGASENHVIGPFPVETYNQSTGDVFVDYSDVTDGTIAVLRLGN